MATGITPDELLQLPPVALRKVLAYYRRNTHWTERVEYYLQSLVYYTVRANGGDATLTMEKFAAPRLRNAPAPRQTTEQIEGVAAQYGKRQQNIVDDRGEHDAI